MNQHWTETDFLSEIYGVGPAGSHLEGCEECRNRLQDYRSQRRRLIAHEPAVPAGLLNDQRVRIQDRVDHAYRRGAHWRWSPAIVMAGLAFCAIVWKAAAPPPPKVEPVRVEMARAKADPQLMVDIYRSIFESEPGAVEAVEGLFEANR